MTDLVVDIHYGPIDIETRTEQVKNPLIIKIIFDLIMQY